MTDIRSLARIEFKGLPLSPPKIKGIKESTIVLFAGPVFDFNDPLYYAVNPQSVDGECLLAKHVGLIRPPFGSQVNMESHRRIPLALSEVTKIFRDQEVLRAFQFDYRLNASYDCIFARPLNDQSFELPDYCPRC